MKQLVAWVVIIILISIQPVSATLDPADAGAEMVKKGINSFIIGIADNLYDAGMGIHNTSVTNKTSTNAIFAVATYTYDPFKSENVQNMQAMSAVIFLILMILYIFLGAIGVVVTRFIPQLTTSLSFVLGRNAYGQYVSNLATGMCVALFIYIVLRFILTLNYVLTHLIIVDILESVAPSIDNVVLYFMMAICYFFMNVFFAWRMLIIGIVVAFALVFGVMLVYDSTKYIARGVFSYFTAMVFMQAIICGATSVGVKIIQAAGFPQDSQVVMYLALILLLIIISLLMCLGIHRVIWSGKKVTKVIL